MQTIDYTTTNKSTWGPGPWHDEVDKRQWQDPATGYPCLLVRNCGGAWCGYVGVYPGHPAYGVDYSKLYEVTSVHGALTFADHCADNSREEWQRQLARFPAYAESDTAVRELWGPVIHDYDAWRRQREATVVCHVPDADEPGAPWWLGFDCAHGSDLSPGHRATLGERLPHLRSGTYRTLDYAKRHVESLALQLQGLAQAGWTPPADEDGEA